MTDWFVLAPKGSCGSVRLIDALEFACEGDEGEAFAEGVGAPRASEPPGMVVRRERMGNVLRYSYR